MCFYVGRLCISNMDCIWFSVCFADFYAPCSFLLDLCSENMHAHGDYGALLVVIVLATFAVLAVVLLICDDASCYVANASVFVCARVGMFVCRRSLRRLFINLHVGVIAESYFTYLCDLNFRKLELQPQLWFSNAICCCFLHVLRVRRAGHVL